MEQSLTSLRSELAYREPIRPFVCSTFVDFAEEREHLAKAIFPRLAVQCRERGTQFLPVDFRWNEESYTTNSASVLQQCFEAIEHCSPYFICLLGERYGVHRPPNCSLENAKDENEVATVDWLEKNFETAAATSGNEWVLDEENRHCSITEMEIIKAAFRERIKHAFFYFRDPERVRKQSDGQDVSRKALLMEIFESENDFAAKKIKDLKQQIIDTGLPVKYFKSPEELGHLVMKDWLSVLNTLYPPLSKTIFPTSSSEDYREWSTHEAFAGTRRKVFVMTSAIRLTRDVLTRHAQYFSDMNKSRASTCSLARTTEGSFLTSIPELESFPPIVALVGERGYGVTSIIANWVHKFRNDNPSSVVICHYAESGQRAAEITSFMRRCTKELRLRYSGCHFCEDVSHMTNFDSVVEAFQASLSLGPCVIVLDGLSHLASCHGIPAHVIKQLSWLPKNLPPSCRVVVSTTRADLTCKHLHARSDVHVIDVQPLLSNDEKSRVLHAWLGKHASYLDPRDHASILAGKLSSIPLYHVALANEIRLHGRARIPEKQLEAYTHARNFADFWTAVIHRWSHDYSWLKPAQVKSCVPMKTQVSKDRLNNGWIPDALRLISVSREGVTRDEITMILRAFGYNRKHGISPAAWRSFMSAAAHALYVRADGLISYQQATVREAVDCLLLNGLTSPSRVRHVTPFEISWEVQKFQYHSVLTNSFSVFPCDLRLAHELPWQHKASGDVIGLQKTLARPEVFVRLWSTARDDDLGTRTDFVNYWKFLSENDFDAVETYCGMVAEAETNMVGGTVRDNGESEDIDEGISERIINKKPNEQYTNIEVSYLAYLVGTYFLALQDFMSAETMLLKAFSHARNATSIDDLDYLCQVQRSIGDLYQETIFLEKALLFYEGALKTAAEVTRFVNVKNKNELTAIKAHVHKSIAAILVRRILASSTGARDKLTTATTTRDGSRDSNESELASFVPQITDALNEARRLTEICKIKEAGSVASIDHTVGLLAFCQGQYNEADISLNRALEDVERWYGLSHLSIATILQDLAQYHLQSECEITDLIYGEKLLRRALNIKETKLGKCHLNVSETLVQLGCSLQGKGTRDGLEESRNMLQRAVDIRTEQLGVSHESTKHARRMLVKFQ